MSTSVMSRTAEQHETSRQKGDSRRPCRTLCQLIVHSASADTPYRVFGSGCSTSRGLQVSGDRAARPVSSIGASASNAFIYLQGTASHQPTPELGAQVASRIAPSQARGTQTVQVCASAVQKLNPCKSLQTGLTRCVL